MTMRIGYRHADRLISYPYAHNLSMKQQPIRVDTMRGNRCTSSACDALAAEQCNATPHSAIPTYPVQYPRAMRSIANPGSTAGMEGAGGSGGHGCGTHGRRQGLAGLRGEVPPHTAPQAPPVWRAPEGPEGQGGLRDRPLRAAGSRVAISRAAGPDGAQNTSGATSNKTARPGRRKARLRSPWAAAGPDRASRGSSTTHSDTSAAGVEGAGGSGGPGCGARGRGAGPGRASRRRAERSSQRGRLAGGPPPTGTPSSPT